MRKIKQGVLWAGSGKLNRAPKEGFPEKVTFGQM